MRRSTCFFACVLLLTGRPLFAQGVNCRDVGGAMSTNFLTPINEIPGTTMGTATGDLHGGVGVTVTGVTPSSTGLVFHNQHQWVTEAGDTIQLAQADATAFPTPVGGLFAVSYLDGVQIAGGTGRFEHATGTLRIFGAANLATSQIVLRYQGTICAPPVLR